MSESIEQVLQRRLGSVHAQRRLAIERDHEAQAFGQGLNFIHLENWDAAQFLIRNGLKLTGLYGRGARNAAQVMVKHNDVGVEKLPGAFDSFTILHISDLHVDMNREVMTRLPGLVEDLSYDLCVLTGDYRGETYGPFAEAMEGMARLRARLRGPVYGVLGNHDSIEMVPVLEGMGIRMLLNESVRIDRSGAGIHLAGIDDAHFYRMDDIKKAAADIPREEVSILLSHTPEVFRQAADAGFDLLLSGHTHGGQICLPGGIPITLEAAMPRRFGAGAWRYRDMAGYTSVGAGSSVVPVRFNCPPEITLHHLHIR